jgi:hypothetical protein
MVPRGGVNPALGGSMLVTQQGAPTMGITVATGHCVIPGSEGTTQGAYVGTAPTSTNIAVTAAHATLPRIDIVCAKVEDSAYSGANNLWSLVVVTGTAAASPAVPAAPNNSITLAQIAVAAAATSIVNANITDTRLFLAGGIIPIPSIAALPVAPYEGMYVYARATDRMYFYDGAAWQGNSERYPGIAVAYATVGQTVTNVTDTLLSFNAEDIDTDGWHDNVTNNSRLTPNVPGYYRVWGNLYWAFNTTMSYSDVYIAKNGTVVARAGNLQFPSTGQNNVSKFGGNITHTLQMNGSSDYVQLGAFHQSGVSQTTNAGFPQGVRFGIEFIRPL